MHGPGPNLIPIPAQALAMGFIPHHLTALGTAWLAAYRGLFKASPGPKVDTGTHGRDSRLQRRRCDRADSTRLRPRGNIDHVTACSPEKAASAKASALLKVFTPSQNHAIRY